MEPEHESKNNNKAAVDNISRSTSSSSSTSNFLDPDEILDASTPPKELGDIDGEELESPPRQVMERDEEVIEGDPNRIPAHVFDRTKSSAPEWSVCSNESLFSIHMGAMSFTREQMNWLGKSGELGLMGEHEHDIDFTSNEPPSSQVNAKNAEAAAADPMRDVIVEETITTSKNNNSPSPPTTSIPETSTSTFKMPTRPTTPSRHSTDSMKSFAFPILTGGDGEQGESSEGKSKDKDKDKDKDKEKDKEKEKQKKQTSLPRTPKTPQSQASSNPHTPKNDPEVKKKEAGGIGQIKWLSCFSCCPFCS